MDDVAQEGVEEFTLSLTVLYPQNVFVQDTVLVRIRDTTREFVVIYSHCFFVGVNPSE